MRRLLALSLIAAVVPAAALAPAGAQQQREDAVASAGQLWSALREARLAGEGAVNAVPHAATPPHGAMVETFFSAVTWRGRRVRAVVLRDYGPPGVSAVDVMKDRATHLEAISVMVAEPDGGGWTWTRYRPDGVASQAADCAACHALAPGGDFLYSADLAP